MYEALSVMLGLLRFTPSTISFHGMTKSSTWFEMPGSLRATDPSRGYIGNGGKLGLDREEIGKGEMQIIL